MPAGRGAPALPSLHPLQHARARSKRMLPALLVTTMVLPACGDGEATAAAAAISPRVRSCASPRAGSGSTPTLPRFVVQKRRGLRPGGGDLHVPRGGGVDEPLRGLVRGQRGERRDRDRVPRAPPPRGDPLLAGRRAEHAAGARWLPSRRPSVFPRWCAAPPAIPTRRPSTESVALLLLARQQPLQRHQEALGPPNAVGQRRGRLSRLREPGRRRLREPRRPGLRAGRARQRRARLPGRLPGAGHALRLEHRHRPLGAARAAGRCGIRVTNQIGYCEFDLADAAASRKPATSRWRTASSSPVRAAPTARARTSMRCSS